MSPKNLSTPQRFHVASKSHVGGTRSTGAVRPDPYATRAQKQFDALLLLIIALTIFIGFRAAMKDRAHRAAAGAGTATAQLVESQSQSLVNR